MARRGRREARASRRPSCYRTRTLLPALGNVRRPSAKLTRIAISIQQGEKNMNVTRRNFLAGTGIAATAVLAGCGSSDGGSASGEKTYKIGVVQLTEHAALDASNEGFVEAVNASGLPVSIDQQNAQNDQSACQTIASKFVGDGVDLIFAIATPAAQAAAGATTEIPIVGTAITDFAASGLVQDNDKPGTNVTGSSDLTPVAEQLEMMQKVLPDVKKVGLLYCSAESNSDIHQESPDELDALGLSTPSSPFQLQRDPVRRSPPVGKWTPPLRPYRQHHRGRRRPGGPARRTTFLRHRRGGHARPAACSPSINYKDLGKVAGDGRQDLEGRVQARRHGHRAPLHLRARRGQERRDGPGHRRGSLRAGRAYEQACAVALQGAVSQGILWASWCSAVVFTTFRLLDIADDDR